MIGSYGKYVNTSYSLTKNLPTLANLKKLQASKPKRDNQPQGL
jgi:hypothetical protein